MEEFINVIGDFSDGICDRTNDFDDLSSCDIIQCRHLESDCLALIVSFTIIRNGENEHVLIIDFRLHLIPLYARNRSSAFIVNLCTQVGLLILWYLELVAETLDLDLQILRAGHFLAAIG